MKLQSEIDRLHAAGGEIVAISVDEEVRQAGMFDRWPLPNVLFVSDPEGSKYLRPLGLFDPVERGGLGLPALLVLEPSGTEVFRYTGGDFADRVADEAMFAALEELKLDPNPAPAGGPIADIPEELRGYFRPVSYTAYMNGSRTGSLALSRRVSDEEAKADLVAHTEQMQAALDAWASLKPSK